MLLTFRWAWTSLPVKLYREWERLNDPDEISTAVFLSLLGSKSGSPGWILVIRGLSSALP